MPGSEVADAAPSEERRWPFWVRHTEGIVYFVGGITYIPVATWEKFLLDWIVGPAWLLAFVWLVLPPVQRRADRYKARVEAAEAGPLT